MRRPLEDIKIFAERRKKLAQQIEGKALIVCAQPECVRNSSVEHPYRQNSNMYYLTGFEEPESVLLMRPGRTPETVMFVRKRDRNLETWNGFRYGPEGVEQNFKIEKVFPIDEFETEAPKLLIGIDELYYSLFKNPDMDKKVQNVLESVSVLQKRKGYGLMTIHDAYKLLAEMRIIKSDYELENLRRACHISAEGHVAAMRFTKPGVNEHEIQAVLAHHFLMRGAKREGYNYIVASGNNATTLHYNFNDQICRDGELLLIDSGAEYRYYTGDITRTFPVNGKFNEAQAKVYEGVLKIQKQIIDYIKPGVYFKDLHEMGASLLTDLMLELGLFNGRKQDILEAQEHRKYYPHGIGHWLGMDVHDVGYYFIDDEPRPLEKGMTFTVEPGIYIPEDDDSAPEELRGIGIRIEDNLLVTSHGAENLTSNCPKEIAEIEAIVGKG